MKVHLLHVTGIKRETYDSHTYLLQPASGSMSYKAGQFLTLIISIDGKELRRSYSFGSTPEIDAEIFITIKRIQNGFISRYIFDHLKVGDTLKCLPPAGRFTIDGKKRELHCFIAAGSGITPVFSLIKEVLYKQTQGRVILLYQNTNEARSIYRQQLLLLQKHFADRFTLLELFSQPSNNSLVPRRLNNFLLESIVIENVNTSEVQFYLCGPGAFMRMAQFTLKVLGYTDDQISKENFVVDFVPPPPFIEDTSPKDVLIHFKGRTFQIRVAYPQNILDAALKNNINLPYSCRGGRCSSCTARCIHGQVKMSINDVLTDNDLQEGLVLTCVGYATTNLELDFN